MTELAMPSPGVRAGQATMVEQARAMAEVHAMMAIARDYPRSELLARDRMRDACSRMALAEKAFYRFPRNNQQVTGASVHLARELARCYGNITFDVKEMARRDDLGQSEMMAYAWDIEINVRSGNTFIVPHKRDAGGKTVDLTQMRDIYENNANAGARRMRECIFAVLPQWYRDEAIMLCTSTLERGADPDKKPVPLIDRKHNAIESFRSDFQVTERQLSDKIGRPEGQWRAGDIATLVVIYKSLKAGETTVDLEFPREQGHVGNIITPPAPAAPPAERPATSEQLQKIGDCVNKFGDLYSDATEITKDIRVIVGRSDATLANLSTAEAIGIVDAYERCIATDNPAAALDIMLDDMRTPEGP